MYFKSAIINTTDFDGFYYFPLRIEYEKINNSILSSQNVKLSQVLGDNLYNDFLQFWQKTIEIQNITVGTETIIQISNTTLLDNTSFCKIANSEGLFPPSFTEQNPDGTFSIIKVSQQENEFYPITIIDSMNFSIPYDSTGKNITNFGNLQSLLSQSYYNLYLNIVPYLVFLSISDYLPTAKKNPTKYSVVQKSTNQSTDVNNTDIALEIKKNEGSAIFWQNKLYKFLEDNASIYTLYEENKKEVQNNRVFPIKAKQESIIRKYYQ